MDCMDDMDCMDTMDIVKMSVVIRKVFFGLESNPFVLQTSLDLDLFICLSSIRQ